MKSKLRVLHGPVNVGNQPWSLSRAERRLGLKSDLVVNYGTWLGYPADHVLSDLGAQDWWSWWKRYSFAISAPFRYDVIHYYFGRSFTTWDDLGSRFGRGKFCDKFLVQDAKIAKWLGKRLFMTLQGCDIRLASGSTLRNTWTPCQEDRCGAFKDCLNNYDTQRRAMRDSLLPLMDRVFILNPELGHEVVGGIFLPYANVDIGKVRVRSPHPFGPLRIVHAPSNPSVKGTNMLLAALDKLKSRHDFELLLVQNMPHAQAMKVYESADLALDQILYGWYGGFAVEMMAMGKPVAAYIREEDRMFVPAQLWKELPILRLEPGNLEDSLDAVLSRREELIAWGEKSRKFVDRWHDPNKIARWMLEVYEDPTTLPDWHVN